MRSTTKRGMVGGALLGLCACRGELEAPLDILPQRYPNRLESGEEEITAVVFRPENALATPDGARAVARAVQPGDASRAEADVSGSEVTGSEVTGSEVTGSEVTGSEVTGSVAFRDVDGDGRRDAVVRFSVADLRAAGLLGGATHTVEIQIEGTDVSWVGRDRLFEADTPLIVLPEPSGPFDVGTAGLVAYDATRAGNTGRGRALRLRIWYPALASNAQPAPYFLDPECAERNLAAGPFPLPADLFELTHGSARERAAVAVAPIMGSLRRPALILSTGWDAPVEAYSALAEDLASQGYVVVGVNHPNGSGAVVYPDGSEPGLDPAGVIPDDDNNLDWALDLERVAEWLSRQEGALDGTALGMERATVGPVLDALALVDRHRIGALGHSFGGSAAIRADADSPLIAASANLDGPILGDAAALAQKTRSLVLLSPAHSAFDSSIGAFASGAGSGTGCYAIEGTLQANFGDTGWLYERLLEENPDLQREGYGLGAIAPERAHRIVSSLLSDFFATTLADAEVAPEVTSAMDLPEVADFPEVTTW